MIELRGLSLHQPWVDLIVRRIKTMELRQWELKWRGTIALHATAGSIDMSTSHLFGYSDPWLLPRGKIVGLATVYDVLLLDERNFVEYFSEHRQVLPTNGPVFGIQLRDIRVLKNPIPYRGKPGLFPIDEATINDIMNTAADSA
jgi:hypothetical protein